MKRTPISVLVIGIIGIVISGFMLLLLPCGLYFTFHPLAPNPVLDTLNKDPIYFTMTIAINVLSLILNLYLLIASISALKLISSAHGGMIAYAWIEIIYTLAHSIYSFAYVVPKMSAALGAMPGGRAAGPFAAIGGIIGGIVGILIAIALPVAILICFRRTIVINAFKGVFPAAVTNFPVQYPDQPPNY